MSENFAAYKEALEANSSYINALRKDVERIITQRQLNPLMNDTKWLELQEAVGLLPLPPAYIVKCLTDKDASTAGILSEVPEYYGDWSMFYEEGLPPFFDIEWIKVRTVYGIHRGGFVSPEVHDATIQFKEILENLMIPNEEEKSLFTIYGYR